MIEHVLNVMCRVSHAVDWYDVMNPANHVSQIHRAIALFDTSEITRCITNQRHETIAESRKYQLAGAFCFRIEMAAFGPPFRFENLKSCVMAVELIRHHSEFGETVAVDHTAPQRTLDGRACLGFKQFTARFKDVECLTAAVFLFHVTRKRIHGRWMPMCEKRAPRLERSPNLLETFVVDAVEKDIASIHSEAFEVFA
ncbi:hypothetical protein WT09_15395 [Burkholderia stagnalis]|nr:hypothetical protein WT09_15395 [Burkholderia stagnalis]